MPELHMFDVCVITVSDQPSVARLSELIDLRQQAGIYPREIQFRVYADPQAGRVGSGGGTMWALQQLIDGQEAEDPDDYLASTRIVMLHAGGESRRLPCYAPEGKLFAPVPLSTSTLLPPVVLDAQLALFLKYPWRDGELLVGSGDVVIDFDTSAMKRPTAGITGFAAPASVEQGARHGVFEFDPTGEHVEEYHQKRSAEYLRTHARIEGTDQCALDIGLISMSPEYTGTLLDIGRQLRGKLAQAQVYVDIYLEILTAGLSSLSLEAYLERVGLQSKADDSVKRAIFARLHRFPLAGVLTHDPTFIHFGALSEYPDACRRLSRASFLPFYAQERGELGPSSIEPSVVFNTAAIDRTIGAELRLGDPEAATTSTTGDDTGGTPVSGAPHRGARHPAEEAVTLAPGSSDCYVEGCGPPGNTQLGRGAGLVGVRRPSALPLIPNGIWIDERSIDGEPLFLVYGAEDSFKPGGDVSEMTYCGIPMKRWLSDRGLTPKDVWDRVETGDLWLARLFCSGLVPQQLEWFWSKNPASVDFPKDYRARPRFSIREATDKTDPRQRDKDRAARRASLIRSRLMRGLGWRTVSRSDFCKLFPGRRVPEVLLEEYTRTLDPLLAAYRRRMVAQCGSLPKRLGEVQNATRIRYVTPTRDSFPLRRAVKLDQIVWARCPVRLDLAGGWTDTPPYTNRYGGKVVNVAANLNGEPPIQVYCRPISEHHIRFHSIDIGISETCTSTPEILDFENPSSPFALPKAALVLLGVVEEDGKGALSKRLEKIGCGVEVTLMCAVPKGSGLGTSSVLGGTILAALARFFGVEMTRDELYLNVLAMEQMLTTGGGWQDQVGGIAGAVKYIECAPGMRPRPEVHQLDPFLFEDRRHVEQMTLYYTGITRLAKNILQDIVDRVNDNEPAYLFTHRHLAELATAARRRIALRDYEGLCRVVASSWRANKLVHAGTSNEEIEAILAATQNHYAAVKLLGAGGGGYALFLSTSIRDADHLRDVLEHKFDNGRSRLVEFSLNPQGLRVSVS